jgi:hypothetical protein
MLRMAQKQTVSFRMDPHLLQRFQQASDVFKGKLGACFSAACLQWLESDPEVQGEYLMKLYQAELRGEVEAAVEQAKAIQSSKIKVREQAKGKRG